MLVAFAGWLAGLAIVSLTIAWTSIDFMGPPLGIVGPYAPGCWEEGCGVGGGIGRLGVG